MFDEINKTIAGKKVKLVVVSKTQAPERILAVYQLGQRAFGENRAQEMRTKHAALPTDIEWHLIGHLQTNKVKLIAPFVQMIHSVDSLDLLQEIDKQALKANRVIDCLLQFHIAKEDTKYGFEEFKVIEMLNSAEFQALSNIRVCGVMGMATFTDDQDLVRKEFALLKNIFDRLKSSFFANSKHFTEISMGMSSDWKIALESGSTMLRIGSLLFESQKNN